MRTKRTAPVGPSEAAALCGISPTLLRYRASHHGWQLRVWRRGLRSDGASEHRAPSLFSRPPRQNAEGAPEELPALGADRGRLGVDLRQNPGPCPRAGQVDPAHAGTRWCSEREGDQEWNGVPQALPPWGDDPLSTFMSSAGRNVRICALNWPDVYEVQQRAHGLLARIGEVLEHDPGDVHLLAPRLLIGRSHSAVLAAMRSAQVAHPFVFSAPISDPRRAVTSSTPPTAGEARCSPALQKRTPQPWPPPNPPAPRSPARAVF